MSLRAAQGIAVRQRSSLPTARKPSVFRPSASTSRSLISTPSLDEYVQKYSPDLPSSATASTSSNSSFSARRRLIAIKTRMLLDAMSVDSPNTHIVWSYYRDLLDLAGFDFVPLEVHQLVLRNAVDPPLRSRMKAKASYRTVHFPSEPHPYEDRLLAVIRNVRSAGLSPSLEDYHWVLDQFAAVGHYAGAERVLAEMHNLFIDPTPATYGYILQACAHRATLPCKSGRGIEQSRDDLLDGLHSTCSRVLSEMAERNIPVTPINVDLAVRTLRNHADHEEFDRLIKRVYGLDLSFLESTPLDSATTSRDGLAAASSVLSTDGLNTILDSLGMQGRISKMVEAFEVLTRPLPAAIYSPSSFDDDDDAPYSNSHNARTLVAEPNSTTFRILLRHAAKANNSALVRHYALVAYHAEKDQSRTLRGRLRADNNGVPPAPRVMLQRAMLLPVMHVANRDRDSPLLRWVWLIARRSASTKWAEMDELSEWARQYETPKQDGTSLEATDEPGQVSGQTTSTAELHLSEASPSLSTSPPSSQFPAETGSPLLDGLPNQIAEDVQSNGVQATDQTRWLPPPTTFFVPNTSPDALEEQDTAESPEEILRPSDRPALEPSLHLSLLRRERDRLAALMHRIENTYERTQQRVKERLGRRVWAQKDVFLRTADDRVTAERAFWRQTVNFSTPEELRERRHKFWGPPMPFTREAILKKRAAQAS